MKKILKKYLDRLHDSIQRSALLRAYPPKSITSRIDLNRLSCIDETLPLEVLNSVLFDNDKSQKIAFEYDELPRLKQEIDDYKDRNQPIPEELQAQYEHLLEIYNLYKVFAKKLTRDSDLIQRETGLRSLWIGYPLAFVSAPTKSILAPVFLWPVDVKVSLKKQGEIIISRGDELGIPIYNKAFDYWCTKNLGINPDDPSKETLKQPTEKDLKIILDDIFKGFSSLPKLTSEGNLEKIPTLKSLKGMTATCLLHSAILGIVKWENQALMRDLEEMVELEGVPSLVGSFLTGEVEEKEEVKLKVSEANKHSVSDLDVSQDEAVLKSRSAPGTIVHGPPGTGKSETILNVVADALARNEKVLVVCQKRAAIDVVFERLKKVGLDSLACLIHDSNSDRKTMIQSTKEQVEMLSDANLNHDAIKRQRNKIIAEIDALEEKLNSYVHALHFKDEKFRYKYRDAKAAYLNKRDKWNGVKESRELGEYIKNLEPEQLYRIDHQICHLISLAYEGEALKNPWKNRSNNFAIDRFVLEDIKSIFNQLLKLLDKLDDKETAVPEDACFDDSWLEKKELFKEFFSKLNEYVNEEGYDFFNKAFGENKFENIEQSFDFIDKKLKKLNLKHLNLDLHKSFYGLNKNETKELLALCDKWEKLESSFFGKLSLSNRKAKKNITKKFSEQDILLDEINPEEAKGYFRLLLQWQDLKPVLELLEEEGIYNDGKITINSLKRNVDFCEQFLKKAKDAKKIAKYLDEIGDKSLRQLFLPQKYSLFLGKFEKLKRYVDSFDIRSNILDGIQNLNEWLKLDVVNELKRGFSEGVDICDKVQSYIGYLSKLESLIQFDSEMEQIQENEAIIIRQIVDDCLNNKESDMSIKEIVASSSDYFWINVYSNICIECEKKFSVLISYSGELYDKDVMRLKELIKKKRELEPQFILSSWLEKQIRQTERDWKSILVVKGKNSKRLRQVVDLGQGKGLFDLRPCWLTNPNIACEIFPLQKEYFDTVVFDEASQCPIEQALPIIYRAKKIIVAGDEKQLPPTSFFKSGFEIEEEEENELPDDELSSSEVTERNLKRAQTEAVLNSEDLLNAAKTLLEDCYLNVHYRSEHPALIDFSNYAFYSARLEVPQIGLQNSYLEEPPVVYFNVKGIYDDENQRNPDEAEMVLKLMRKIWQEKHRHSLGIVTFNSKQRDLLIESIGRECEDPEFEAVYSQERDRKDGNQDIGFFVKNLESVQGDERDIMIFSSTFGRMKSGKFYRNFGPISKEGGERRLNVAITRAKKRMYIVTSMPIHEISDIIASDRINPGAKVGGREYLHLFMEYAKFVSEGQEDQRQKVLEKAHSIEGYRVPPKITGDVDSVFEIQVTEALLKEGYEVVHQIGESGFKIDLSIRHKNREKGFVLGIECDGATYHSSWSARIRDIWRQSILERRGWRIHRVWSTSWWRNPEFEIDKIKKKIASIYMEEEIKEDKKPKKDASRRSASKELIKELELEEKDVDVIEDDSERSETDTQSKVEIKSKPKVAPKIATNKKGVKQCSKCSSAMFPVLGKNGPFLNCLKCGHSENLKEETLKEIVKLDVRCPKHRIKMKLEKSRRGFFMRCPVYPKCRHTQMVEILKEHI